MGWVRGKEGRVGGRWRRGGYGIVLAEMTGFKRWCLGVGVDNGEWTEIFVGSLSDVSAVPD